MTDPIVKTVEVAAPAARAFLRFTEGLGTWWPVESHSVSAGQNARPDAIVFEAAEGGAIYEILPDGTRADWGRVLAWDPPSRFTMSWHPGHGEDRATRVEVTFEDLPEGRCRVTLVHTGWEALDDGAERRENYRTGWDGVLARFGP